MFWSFSSSELLSYFLSSSPRSPSNLEESENAKPVQLPFGIVESGLRDYIESVETQFRDTTPVITF